MAERPHQRVVIRKLTLPFILLAGVGACSPQADEASAEKTALASLQQPPTENFDAPGFHCVANPTCRWSKETIRWDFFRAARPSGVPGLTFEGAVQSAANAWDQVSNVDLQRNVSVGSPALADVLVMWVSAPDDPLWGTPPAYAKIPECQDVNTQPCDPPLIHARQPAGPPTAP